MAQIKLWRILNGDYLCLCWCFSKFFGHWSVSALYLSNVLKHRLHKLFEEICDSAEKPNPKQNPQLKLTFTLDVGISRWRKIINRNHKCLFFILFFLLSLVLSIVHFSPENLLSFFLLPSNLIIWKLLAAAFAFHPMHYMNWNMPKKQNKHRWK